MLNGLDLFSGIGGITLALREWVLPKTYCEIDRYARAVLLSRMSTGELPVAPIWDDVRTLKGKMLPQTDMVYGGFPCQDISVAGNGAGLEGERSGLFFEIIRLVGELRPSFVFLENVPAITTKGGLRVISEFASLGYDCRWTIVSASELGACQIRERWFLLAHSNDKDDRLPGRSSEKITKSSLCSEYVGDSDSQRELQQEGLEQKFREWSCDPSWWASEPSVGRVVNGLPFRVDRIRGLGNAVVPAQAREAFRRLMELPEKLNKEFES